MFDLKDKCALITGASGGIGQAVARALHAQGATVALSGTRRDVLEALASSLKERALAIPCDLSDREAVAGLAPAAEAAMGRIDVLVNNAGATRDGLSMRMKDADWDLVLQINLTSAFQLARACLKGMMRRRAGRIIGIGSIVGTTGNLGQANYAASKAGMTAMSKSLAQETASRGITVNVVAPGYVETAMTEGLSKEAKGRFASQTPIGRSATPEEVAAAVLYLASDEAAAVTGQTLHVNGGMAMI